MFASIRPSFEVRVPWAIWSTEVSVKLGFYQFLKAYVFGNAKSYREREGKYWKNEEKQYFWGYKNFQFPYT